MSTDTTDPRSAPLATRLAEVLQSLFDDLETRHQAHLEAVAAAHQQELAALRAAVARAEGLRHQVTYLAAQIERIESAWPTAGGEPAKRLRAACAAAVTRSLALYPDADPAAAETRRTGRPASPAAQHASRVIRSAFANYAWRAFRQRFDQLEYRLLPEALVPTACAFFDRDVTVPAEVLARTLIRLAIRRRLRHWTHQGLLAPGRAARQAVTQHLLAVTRPYDLTTPTGRARAVRAIARTPLPDRWRRIPTPHAA